MKKITINDFSGGIQEATSAGDFTPRQWAQLKGIVPSSDVQFETQWGAQTIGSETGFQAVYPLASQDGVFLVGLKTNGTLWWAKSPAANAAYTVANAVSWTQITTARNPGWAAGDSTTQPTISIDANANYKFLCSVPVSVYKYYRSPKSGDLDNPTVDQDVAGTRTVASGVLINTAVRSSGQQVIIAYIDTTGASPVVSALTFPNIRRLPSHGSNGDFINAKTLDASGNTLVVTVPAWMSETAFERLHPYTYIDINGGLNPGTGIIPRANVGTMKGDKLILGDIEWRTDFTDVAAKLTNVQIKDSTGADFGMTVGQAVWPVDIANTSRVIFNQGPGIVYLKDTSSITAYTLVGGGITSRRRGNYSGSDLLDGVSEITTASAHGLVVGDTVTVSITPTASSFNGTFVVTYASGNVFRYNQPGQKDQTPYATASGETAEVRKTSASNYTYKVEVGAYQAIPNDWDNIFVLSSAPSTQLFAARQLNMATHIMNDNNTGPHRGSIYYAEADLDEFDPRSVLRPSKTDVRVAGLHTLDDTIIAITTAGSEGDGVFRIRGFLSKLHPYSGTADPTAVRIELVRGGIGAAEKTSTVHKNFSCVWSEAGIVVFIDRLGGVFYTDGVACDRLDRFGPVAPAFATEDDHVAALGKHLFAYRDGRLLCFTMLGSEGGSKGNGCWTELVIPAGGIKSMVGIRQDLYFVNSGKVMRFALGGPVSERGKFDGVAQTITVSTATIGSDDEHDRTTWHRFGMTFTTPTSCAVTGVTINSTGALNTGVGVAPNVAYQPITSPRTFSDPGVLGEIVVPAGIGPQAVCSATVTFTGYVRLKSASFWTTGREPRRGDQ